MILHQIKDKKALYSLESSLCVNAVGETSDDSQREEKDHVLRHFPRHRHHLRGLVALRPD